MYEILSFNTKYLYLYLYVSGYSCPNGWTEWAEILKESLEYPGGNKKIQNFFFHKSIFISRATLGASASNQYFSKVSKYYKFL